MNPQLQSTSLARRGQSLSEAAHTAANLEQRKRARLLGHPNYGKPFAKDLAIQAERARINRDAYYRIATSSTAHNNR